MKTSISLLICSLVFFLAAPSNADEACKCTESDLAAVKQTAQSMCRLPTVKKVKILEEVCDDVEEFNEDLLRATMAEVNKVTKSDARTAKRLIQYFADIVDTYPDTTELQDFVEVGFEKYPEVCPMWHKSLPAIAESFVKALGEEASFSDQQTETWQCCLGEIAETFKTASEEMGKAREKV